MSKCGCGGNTHTLLKLLPWNYSSALPPLTPAADPLWFCLIPRPSSLSSNPTSSDLSLSPSTPSSSVLFHYPAQRPSSLLLLSPFITTSTFLSLLLRLLLNLNPDQSTISCTFFITFLSYGSCWAQRRVILLFCLTLTLTLTPTLSLWAALQGPADWIRAFYSHWVDHRAEMQISVGMESVL